MNERASGILLHITSLPSKYGIGDLGPGAYRFVDFLVRGRQRYWQVLPLNQIILDGGYSPYNCLSVFGGNTLFISPELLYREGLLTRKDFQGVPVFPESRVNYKDAIRYKRKLLDIAFERFRRRSTKAEYERFCSKNNFWLKDYALFAVLCEHFGGWLWGDWPSEIAERNKAALETVEVQLQDAILKEKFLQYLFFKQWFSLRDYCRQKGVGIIGDIGFYVAYESADVWSHPEIFKLTWAGKPKYVGGVPPDYFSKKGQMWGNPVYDWRALGNSGYEWWIKRVRHNLNLFDVVRIDHFRGFSAYWQIPAGSRTARNGKWVKGPKEKFFDKLFRFVPSSSIIAEDLGYITKDVKGLIERYKLAGMRVLQFAFDGDLGSNVHVPFNHKKNCVIYTGTHDNNTIRGWFEKEASSKQKERLFDYLGHKVSARQVHSELIRLAMSSVGRIVIIAMQDILGLGAGSRMNKPGTLRGNWRWRLCRGQISKSTAVKLARLAEAYGRG